MTVTRTAVLMVTCAFATVGCSGPPPALPVKVLEQGLEAVPEDHPEMTAQQLVECGVCHRASNAAAK